MLPLEFWPPLSGYYYTRSHLLLAETPKTYLTERAVTYLQASSFDRLEHTAVRRVLLVDSVQEIYFDNMLWNGVLEPIDHRTSQWLCTMNMQGVFFLPKIFLLKTVESSLSFCLSGIIKCLDSAWHNGDRTQGYLEAKSSSFVLSKNGKNVEVPE